MKINLLTTKYYRIKSYGKINLILKIGEKKNNYHTYFSLMSKINFYDTLNVFIKKDNKNNFQIKSNNKSIIKNNILEKTWNELNKEIKELNNYSIYIKLKKNIPIGSGLGSGSSNAASLIDIIFNFLKINNLEKKYKIGSKIGMDVNFFINNNSFPSTKISYGFGEKIKNINWINKKLNFILINEKINLSTKKMYKNFKKYKKINLEEELININKNIFINDFNKIARKKYPLIDRIFSNFENKVDYIMLSGSGSSIVIADKDKNKIKKIFKNNKNKFKIIKKIKLI